MASGPGTGVAAPPEQHVPKGTIHDPALQAAVQRAVATNDTASLAAMGPAIQAAADHAALTGGTGSLLPSITQAAAAALPALMQTALTPQGNVVSLPAPQQQALQQLAAQQAAVPQQQYQNQVARAEVNRITSAVNPELEAIRQDLEHRSNQIQATSEHRRIEQRNAFQRNVLRRLGRIEYAARIMRY